MGKVGSNTVTESLRASGYRGPLFHVHNLTLEGLQNTKHRNYKYRNRHPGKPYWTGCYLRKQWLIGSSQKWKIVSLTREPVGRNISAFFQGLDFWFPDHFDVRGETDRDNLMGEFRQNFLEHFPHNETLNWFDKELYSMFGLDVYNEDFPVSQGYKIYHRSDFELLIIRLEDFNRCAGKAFGEFLGLEDTWIVNSNVGKNKMYGKVYRLFKQHVRLPDDYLQAMYSSKYAEHFYGEKEIISFRERWSEA
jgi:hypothetical protein